MTNLCIRAAVLLAISCIAHAPAAEYGQSNMDGRVPFAQRPATCAAMPGNVRMYSINAQGDLSAPKTELVTKQERIGPVPFAALSLSASRPHDTFIILKHAVGATALWEWVTDYDAGAVTIQRKNAAVVNGHLYAPLAKGLSALRAAHPKAAPLAALWLQGEAETNELAAIYLPNLKRLVANLRRDMGSATTAFISADPASGNSAVYAAFASLTTDDPRSRHIAAKSLPHMDSKHYNLEAVRIIGDRYTEMLVEFLPKH